MGDLLQLAATRWYQWDASCSHFVRSSFASVGLTELLGKPAAPLRGLPAVASPTPLATAIIAYLTLICISLFANGRRSGSNANGSADQQKTRESAVFRGMVQLHNAFLVCLSSYMCGRVIYEAVKNKYALWGNEYNPAQKDMAVVIYVFYLSKMYEFLDTVIMIVKGNMRQVSFLHVYHHVSISIIWWVIAYIAPGGDAYYSAALNSLVHVVMYTYYLLASTVGKDEKTRRKYLWWGRYLTMFQMAQFVSMLAQAIHCIVTNTYNQFLSKMLVGYMITLLTLFANFFARKYFKKDPKGKLA